VLLVCIDRGFEAVVKEGALTVSWTGARWLSVWAEGQATDADCQVKRGSKNLGISATGLEPAMGGIVVYQQQRI
jgi:hypothetical protein